jgi:hypothetical protein
VVLDLGEQPAADLFPPAEDPGPDQRFPLAMWWCRDCGLAQLLEDASTPDEPRALEPRAAVEQAHAAVTELCDSGLLRPSQYVEFASPHGGSWGEALGAHGFAPAAGGPTDLVVDINGLMHDPDQCAGIRRRARALTEDGTLLLQFPTFASTLEHGEWNALRHGHFAYHSVPAARRLLALAGLTPFAVRRYSLYSGSVLLLASRSGRGPRSEREALASVEADEIAAGVQDVAAIGELASAPARDVSWLRDWVSRQPAGAWLYGAGSRAVAVLASAGLPDGAVAAVVDGSPAKQGRRMPGTSIPIVAPAAMLAADPARILLMLPDLLPEVQASWPALADRWVLHGGPGR